MYATWVTVHVVNSFLPDSTSRVSWMPSLFSVWNLEWWAILIKLETLQVIRNENTTQSLSYRMVRICPKLLGTSTSLPWCGARNLHAGCLIIPQLTIYLCIPAERFDSYSSVLLVSMPLCFSSCLPTPSFGAFVHISANVVSRKLSRIS